MKTPLALLALVGAFLWVGAAHALPESINQGVVKSAVLLKITAPDNQESKVNTTMFPVYKKAGTIRCSGTVLNYGERDFVLTAAHCFEDSVLKDREGKEYYNDAEMYYEVEKDSKKIGVQVPVKVLAVGKSEENDGDDLALLEVKDRSCSRSYARILKPKSGYMVGDAAYNTSSLWGEFVNSYIEGIISLKGHIYMGRQFDTSNLSVRPGSSGSSIQVMDDGFPYIAGVITRWDGSGAFTMFVPIHRVRSWLGEVGYSRLAGIKPKTGEPDHLKNK